MNEEQFKLEARLAAIEYLLCHVLKTQYQLHNISAEVLDAFDRQAEQRAATLTIEGADPVKADIFTDEMGRHVMSVLKDARQMYGK